MPYEQVIPPAFPKWEIDQLWPQAAYDRVATGAAELGSDPRMRRAFPTSAVTTSFMVRVAGVNIAPNYAVHNGLVCVSPQPGASPSALFYATDINYPGPVDNEGFTAADNFLCAMPVPSWKRVFIDEYLISFSNAAIGALGIDTMLWGAVPDQSANQTAIYGGVGTHYGLHADGAGGVQFMSVIGGVLQELVPIVWPTADFRDWVKIIVEHQTANISGGAQLRIWLNDVTNLVLTRNWAAGLLPDMLTVGVGRTIRRYFGQAAGQPANTMFVTGFRCRAGRYTFDGTELA